MKINNPLFIIPVNNKRDEQKPGGRDLPPYLGEKEKFEQHKRQRVTEIDNILKITNSVKPKLSNPQDLTFFEIEFHPKAISKTAQPLELLNSSNIDVYAQQTESTFYASATERNFVSFRDTISKFSLRENAKDCAYLSAITQIKPISKEDKLIGIDLRESDTKGFLFFQDVLPEKTCEEIFNSIKSKYKLDAGFFITTSGSKAAYGLFNQNFLNDISEVHPKNPIQRIEKSIDFVVPQSVAVQYKLDDVKAIAPTTNAVVGIVDSGIEQHGIYKNLIIGVEDYVKNNALLDLQHGTFVGTRCIFGNDIEEQILNSQSLFANSKILDIRVMRKANGTNQLTVNDKELVDAIKDVLSKHGKTVKVYNLSLNNEDHACTHSKKRHFISRELDALAYKHKVIFVISAGNHSNYQKKNYPECLLMDESTITPPADLINGIVAGSIADADSSKSLALNNEPSPFSRTGLDGHKKPDVVHFGGNVDIFNRSGGIGVKGFSVQKDKIEEGVGTSYSAPLVSQITAQIYSYLDETKLWKNTPIELTRALLLHSARYNLPSNSKISANDLHRFVGFGIPDFGRALDCAESTATFVFSSTLGTLQTNGTDAFRASKHKVKFTVPEELVGKDKRVKIRGTLVYLPQISSSASIDYCLADIEVNLHYLNSKGSLISGNLPETRDDYRSKWNPVKSFEKVYTAYKGGLWEIWLTLTARGLADVKEYKQPYALVISVEDVTPNIESRVKLHELIRVKYPQYVQVQQIEAKVRV